jgi:hypothetical protein
VDRYRGSARAKVVMLGHDSAEDLFPNESPIGKDIECEGGIFTVVGVFDSRNCNPSAADEQAG